MESVSVHQDLQQHISLTCYTSRWYNNNLSCSSITFSCTIAEFSYSFHLTAPSSTTLSATSNNNNKDNTVQITYPTSEDAASMGIRDWPQQFKSKPWSESISEGQIATRYILNGKGRVTINYFNQFTGEEEWRRDERVYPGTLVEVDGEATLSWVVDDEREGMIVLTPGFEEGGKFALVLGLLIVFCAGLFAGGGGF
eukprot:scaffold1486_cov186-Alexandrium_tamarense.AAC.8